MTGGPDDQKPAGHRRQVPGRGKERAQPRERRVITPVQVVEDEHCGMTLDEPAKAGVEFLESGRARLPRRRPSLRISQALLDVMQRLTQQPKGRALTRSGRAGPQDDDILRSRDPAHVRVAEGVPEQARLAHPRAPLHHIHPTASLGEALEGLVQHLLRVGSRDARRSQQVGCLRALLSRRVDPRGERLDDLICVPRPGLGVGGEQGRDELRDRLWEVAAQRFEPNVGAVLQEVEDLARVTRRDRAASGQKLEEDAPERVEIRARVHAPPIHQDLGGHVPERARGVPLWGGDGPGEAKVDEFDVTLILGQDEVAWLDVAVDDPAGVEVSERARELGCPPQRVAPALLGRALRTKDLAQRGAVEQLHRHPDPISARSIPQRLDQVWVIKTHPSSNRGEQGRVRLRRPRVQDLERDALALMTSRPHAAHRAAPDLLLQRISVDPRACFHATAPQLPLEFLLPYGGKTGTIVACWTESFPGSNENG